MSVEVRKVEATKYANEMQSLYVEHWKETESKFSSNPPSPMFDVYDQMELGGNLISYGLFDDCLMVGYVIAFLLPHLHYGFLYVQHDILFVKKEYRKGRAGLLLIKSVELESKERGAKHVLWFAKPGTNMESILTKTGSVFEDAVYRKEL